jgi:hypothetical protein
LSNKILNTRVGNPLVVKVSTKYICVGTENGLVLVYRRNQTYKRYTILGTVIAGFFFNFLTQKKRKK